MSVTRNDLLPLRERENVSIHLTDKRVLTGRRIFDVGEKWVILRSSLSGGENVDIHDIDFVSWNDITPRRVGG